jgi:hypothetical protein
LEHENRSQRGIIYRCAYAPWKDAELKNIYSKIIYNFVALFFGILILTGCPLPYKYTPEGYPGTSTGSDPSTPDISAAPVALFTESSGGTGAVNDGQSATTSSDTEIVFSSATVGAVIYYTIDGSTPDPRSPNTRKYAPGSPLKLAVSNPSSELSSASVTARATAIGPNMKPSLITTATLRVQYPQAAAPTFSIASGVYRADQRVELSTATPGAEIYYTMVSGNGPAPRPAPGQQGSVRYDGAIPVNGPSDVWTIIAVAVKDQLIASPIASATYSVTYDGCAAPFFTPEGGTFDNDISIDLYGQAGSTIRYTADGTDPSSNPNAVVAEPGASFRLPGAFTTDQGRITFRAVAAAPGCNPSTLTSATYEFRAAAVQPSRPGGTYDNAFDLSLSTGTQGASIYYTTDGSNPYPNGTPYLRPFAVSSFSVVRAVAVKDGYAMSSEWTGTYRLQVAAPTFSLAGGDYFEDIVVTLRTSTAGARIVAGDGINTWYDLQSGASLTFHCPRTVSLHAYALLDGFTSSSTSNIEYRLWEMPILKAVSAPVPLAAPSLPAGAPSPDYWTGYFTMGFYYGSYTYVVWDHDYQNSTTLVIAAYDDSSSLVRDWQVAGNRYVESISVNSDTGMIEIAGQSGVSQVAWATLRPPL